MSNDRMSRDRPNWTLRYAAHLGVLTQDQPQFLESVGSRDPLEQLRYIAEGKTGSLFGWCGRAAAILANNPEAAQCFDGFGPLGPAIVTASPSATPTPSSSPLARRPAAATATPTSPTSTKPPRKSPASSRAIR